MPDAAGQFKGMAVPPGAKWPPCRHRWALDHFACILCGKTRKEIIEEGGEDHGDQ